MSRRGGLYWGMGSPRIGLQKDGEGGRRMTRRTGLAAGSPARHVRPGTRDQCGQAGVGRMGTDQPVEGAPGAGDRFRVAQEAGIVVQGEDQTVDLEQQLGRIRYRPRGGLRARPG